jgi:hypothetical protein
VRIVFGSGTPTSFDLNLGSQSFVSVFGAISEVDSFIDYAMGASLHRGLVPLEHGRSGSMVQPLPKTATVDLQLAQHRHSAFTALHTLNDLVKNGDFRRALTLTAERFLNYWHE